MQAHLLLTWRKSFIYFKKEYAKSSGNGHTKKRTNNNNNTLETQIVASTSTERGKDSTE